MLPSVSRSEAEVAHLGNGFDSGFGGGRLDLPRFAVPARVLATVAGLVALAAIHVRHRPATLCPFRALTGLPCPFCGGTTAAADLGRGQVGHALATSPLAVAMLAALPFARSVRLPTWWRTRRQVRWSILFLVLAGSELWQLARLHVIG